MVTIKDVAARAGVSVFTVSSVVNHSTQVKPETKKRVLKAIDELGYVQNQAARTLRTQRSYIVGVHMPFFATTTGRSFFVSLAQGIYDVLNSMGYHLILSSSITNVEEDHAALNSLISRGVEGLIIAPSHKDNLKLTRENLPLVIVDSDISGQKADRVFTKNFESSFDAVAYFLDNGHSKIGYVGNTGETTNHKERYLGYADALKKYHIPYDEHFVWDENDLGDNISSSAYGICDELLDKSITAVFCNDSNATIGLVKRMHDRKLKIPDDLAIITYDDYEWYDIVQPPLSAVKQNSYDMGTSAARMLIERIENPNKPFQEVRLDSKLVLRGTT